MWLKYDVALLSPGLDTYGCRYYFAVSATTVLLFQLGLPQRLVKTVLSHNTTVTRHILAAYKPMTPISLFAVPPPNQRPLYT